MNGIDKIIARLNADVDAEIAKIQEETAARCAEIRAEYKTQAENEYWELIQVGVKQTEQRVQRLDRTVHLEVRKHILALKQELAVLETEHTALTAEYEQMFDLATVREAAEAAGMSKPSASQICYLDLTGGDHAVIYQKEESSVLGHVLTSVNTGVGAVVEYFR